jgi:hypothetical protein
MRLEIADTAVSPSHLMAQYKAARQRLLTARPKPKPVEPVKTDMPKPVDPLSALWSPRINAGAAIRSRLGNFVPGVTLTRISQEVCRHFHVTFADLKSASRTKGLVKPRQVVCYLARRHTGRSLADIGRLLGGRDHTTILYSARHVESDYDKFREHIEAIVAKLAVE